jgi:subtilisin family serine protease
MGQKHCSDVSVFIRPNNSAFIIRRKLADWLPTPDWFLFIMLSFIMIATIIGNLLLLDQQIESNHLPQDFVSKQWYLDRIRARQAWSITPGSQDVVVAVVDTGVDYAHHDLAPNIWTNTDEIPDDGKDNDHNNYPDDYYGWDFIDNDGYPMPGKIDGAEHGTMVAGIIGAAHQNGGINGVSGKVQIMPVRVRAGKVGIDSFLPYTEGQYA